MSSGKRYGELGVQERSERAKIILLFLVAAFLVLIVRLFFLQVISYEDNLRLSEKNRMRKRILTAERGIILDRHQHVLVQNRPSFQVVIVRSDMTDPDSLRQRLLSIRDSVDRPLFDSTLVKWRFEQSKWQKYNDFCIMEDAPPQVVALIEERSSELIGVRIETESRRDYIHGTLAAHTLGYLGPIKKTQLEDELFKEYQPDDRVGQSGLEEVYEAYFRGKDGFQFIEVDAYSRRLGLLKGMPHVDAIPGNNLVTTLDLRLQKVAEEAFPDTVRGALVALDPRNGEILAILSSPRLDPNIFSLDSLSRKREWQEVALDSTRPLNNRAVVGIYPPASTFKAFSALAGLREKAITEKSMPFAPCRGAYRFGARVQRCWKASGHGKMNVVDALRESCNIFFYQLGLKINMEPVNKVARMYGLGEPTGVDLPYEKRGTLIDSTEYERRNKSRGWRWTRGLILNLIIGQGQLVTPLQLANSYGALVRGDTLWTPHLMKRVISREGELITQYRPKPLKIIDVDPEDHAIILKGLEAVTSAAGGTGRRMAVPGVRIAGKTGSAENPHGDKTHAWVAAVAPIEDPRIAIAVVLENAGGGGAMAAPVAGAVLRKFFELEQEGVEQ